MAESLAKTPFFDLDSESLLALVRPWGWPAYRARQVLDWAYRKLVVEAAGMSNLPQAERERFAERFSMLSASVTREQISRDGSIKLLLTWPDGRSAETVMIPDGGRRTACVSSQVGCAVGCRFCASGLSGLKGNLSAGQMVEQLVYLNCQMRGVGERISNVVFMGMGEPLANYANVMRAVRILHDRNCLGLGARRITISTVGIPDRIRDLAREELPLNLALSLHAPNEQVRRQLIPWAEHFSLEEIFEALRFYFDMTGREITLEYILLAGVNDRAEHASELARLSRKVRANVNLIRYNEVVGLPYRRPGDEEVMTFQAVLRQKGVNAHVRKSRGRDIDAACGQLRRREAEESGTAGVDGGMAGGEAGE